MYEHGCALVLALRDLARVANGGQFEECENCSVNLGVSDVITALVRR